jgi:pimeloyl-ACP methyl ester carboxylesterase
VLVGHSYAGVVIIGAADRLSTQIGPLVYVDGVVPIPGESWSTRNPPEVQAQRRAEVARFGHLPPPPAGAFSLTGADAECVHRRQTPQPAGVYDDPLAFDADQWAARRRTFVDCMSPPLPTIDSSRGLLRSQPGWNVVQLATGHDLMISAPNQFADLLLAAAVG